MSPLELWSSYPRHVALALLATIFPLISGLTLGAPSNLTPKTHKRSPQEGERRFMYGFTNPQTPEPNGANALVLIQSLSSGEYGVTELVRGLGSGLSGCETVCVRKTTSIQEPEGDGIRMARNEVKQHGRIQSDITNDLFYPRLLGHRETSWSEWPKIHLSSRNPASVEMYQEFVRGRTLGAITHTMAPLKKEDFLSVYAFAMKHVVAAMERLSALNPPLEHNDLNEGNIIVGWIGDETPTITESSLGETRAYLIDFGFTDVPSSDPARRLEDDFYQLRQFISRALRDVGVQLVTPDMRSSHAQRALQLALHLIEKSLRMSDADSRVMLLGTLRQVFDDDVTEKYSEEFRRRFPVMDKDPHAEPKMYVSKAQLIAKADYHEVAGPWHPIEVEYRDGRWEAIRFFEDLWCDWDQCVESSLNKDQPT